MNPFEQLNQFLDTKCQFGSNHDIPAKDLWSGFVSHLEKKNYRITINMQNFTVLMAKYMDRTKTVTGRDVLLRVKKRGRLYYVGLTMVQCLPIQPLTPLTLEPSKTIVKKVKPVKAEEGTLPPTRNTEETIFAPHYMLKIKQQPINYKLQILAFTEVPAVDELTPDADLKQAQQYCDIFFEVIQEIRGQPGPEVVDKELLDRRTRDVLALEAQLRRLQETIHQGIQQDIQVE